MEKSLSLTNTDSFLRYVTEISRIPLLTQEEENELALRYKKNNELAAAHRLVTANLRFVVKIASEYRGYRMRMMDLIQEGNMGLMRAVKKFDPDRGYRLISYAVWWIRAYIQDYIIRSWSLVKVGTTQLQKKLFFKLGKVRGFLNGDELDTAEITALADSREEDAKVRDFCQRLNARDFSLDCSLADSETIYLDLLADDSEDQEESLLLRETETDRRRLIAQALRELTLRERQVVAGRFLGDDDKTLQDVGDELGITRERVRQLESNALKKLEKILGPKIGALALT
ncbi:MAG TPA: sigma-70 family RNA polymerase sigma factor [Proteobacteria bacterium]|nr:sigma-70 family RNA polymerase sigma factor [Pseudomonadota bacterium]